VEDVVGEEASGKIEDMFADSGVESEILEGLK